MSNKSETTIKLATNPNSASGKGTGTGKTTGAGRAIEQKEKRTHSEMEDSSIGDEFTSIHKQLDQLSDEIKQAREDFKSFMKREEMKTFITNTVENLMKSMVHSLENKITAQLEKRLDEKVSEKLGEMSARMDLLTFENVKLREEVDDIKKTLGDSDIIARAAAQRANMNEQYSRKNNVKIMGVEEEGDETEERLIKKLNHILEAKTRIKLDEGKIIAIHRIPGKSGMPKPILVKLMNNNEKTKIMRKRREMKQAGYRLVDDVTKQNTMLINRLSLHKDIDSAWYFNGNVFAKSTAGKRFRFDIYSVIEDVIAGK